MDGWVLKEDLSLMEMNNIYIGENKMKYLISSLAFLIVNLIYAQVSLNVNAIQEVLRY